MYIHIRIYIYIYIEIEREREILDGGVEHVGWGPTNYPEMRTHIIQFNIPKRGIRKGGSDQHITRNSRLNHFKVSLSSDPPFRIPLWGTASNNKQETIHPKTRRPPKESSPCTLTNTPE